MKLKIPPVIVLLVFVGLMYALAKVLPVGYFDFLGRRYLMYGLLGVAIFIGFVALVQFFKNKTTIDPTRPAKATKLVTSGLYRFSRNPMYLAMLLLLLAWGLWLGNAFNTIIAVSFVYYMNAFQIVPEEEALTAIFGKQYRHYCKAVRRWF